MRNSKKADHLYARSRSESSPRFILLLSSTLPNPRRGFVSVVCMSEVILVVCVVAGLAMMAPVVRPILCPVINSSESSAERVVRNLIVARLCNEVWYQSGPSKLFRYELDQRLNELAYSAPEDSVISDWDVSDDGSTLLVSTLKQAASIEQSLTIYRGEDVVVSQEFPRSPTRPALFDVAADGLSAMAILQGMQVRLWDLKGPESTMIEFSLEVAANKVRLDAVHKRIVTVTEQGPIQIYDLQTKRLLNTVELPASDNEPKHFSVNRFAVSHNGQFIVAALVDVLAVYDLGKNEWIWKKRFTEDHSVIELDISADDRSIATSGLSARLFVCDASNGECIHDFASPPDSHSRDLHRIGFAASNDRIYSASFGSTIFEWNLTTFQRRSLEPAVTPSAL